MAAAALALLLAAAIALGLAPLGAGLRWPLESAVGPPAPRTFDVVAYGAKPDNRTDSSAAFAAALKAIALAGGGTLLVPSGGVYLTLPLNLTTSRTRLRVESGATLKALCDNERWPRIPTLPSYAGKRSWFAPFIGASDVQDITLDGCGIIDASGECFWGTGLRQVRPVTASHMVGSRGKSAAVPARPPSRVGRPDVHQLALL